MPTVTFRFGCAHCIICWIKPAGPADCDDTMERMNCSVSVVEVLEQVAMAVAGQHGACGSAMRTVACSPPSRSTSAAGGGLALLLRAVAPTALAGGFRLRRLLRILDDSDALPPARLHGRWCFPGRDGRLRRRHDDSVVAKLEILLVLDRPAAIVKLHVGLGRLLLGDREELLVELGPVGAVDLRDGRGHLAEIP